MRSFSTIPLLAVTGGLELGGSTTFLLNLGRAFKEKSQNLPIMCMMDKNDMAADFSKHGLEVELFSRTSHIYEDRIEMTYKAVAAWQPTAILSCLGSDSFELLRLAPKNVFRMGIIQSDDPAPYVLVRQFSAYLDAIVGVSETICQRLTEDPTLKHVQIEHIPYGIEFAPPVLKTVRDATQPIRIVYIGRMIEMQKQVHRLWELVEVLERADLKFEFTFVGTGPELCVGQERLRKFENVKFLGDLPNNQIVDVLRRNDIFVLLSDFEGLPISLLEAMSEGVVPVVSDVESGMRRVVSGGRGISLPIGDVAAAAAAISALAVDPQRLASIGTSARSYVREFHSAARMAERYLELISKFRKDSPPPLWPEEVEIPVPMLAGKRWMFQGFPRRVRRLLKRLAR